MCAALAVSLAFLGVTIFAIQLTKDTQVDNTRGTGSVLVATAAEMGVDGASVQDSALGTAEAVAEVALGEYDLDDAALADVESVVVSLADGSVAAFAVVAAERESDGTLALAGATVALPMCLPRASSTTSRRHAFPTHSGRVTTWFCVRTQASRKMPMHLHTRVLTMSHSHNFVTSLP